MGKANTYQFREPLASHGHEGLAEDARDGVCELGVSNAPWSHTWIASKFSTANRISSELSTHHSGRKRNSAGKML